MTISALALLSCVLAASLVSGQDDDLLVTLKNGKVRGKAVPAMGGEVRMFLGMPYAKPPVGELRFKKPQPAENWEGVWDATRYSKSCYQASDNSFPGRKSLKLRASLYGLAFSSTLKLSCRSLKPWGFFLIAVQVGLFEEVQSFGLENHIGW